MVGFEVDEQEEWIEKLPLDTLFNYDIYVGLYEVTGFVSKSEYYQLICNLYCSKIIKYIVIIDDSNSISPFLGNEQSRHLYFFSQV